MQSQYRGLHYSASRGKKWRLWIAAPFIAFHTSNTGQANTLRPTSRFDRLIVGFADKLFIVHQIEFVASVELAAAHGAGEALEMVDVILRSTNYLCRWYALLAPSTLRTVTTTYRSRYNFTHLLRIDLENIFYLLFSSVFLFTIIIVRVMHPKKPLSVILTRTMAEEIRARKNNRPRFLKIVLRFLGLSA